ncbi:hypothetical protein BaRGS_00012136 [Batillaria attramentaria]|uniref:Uncharacterized protein n=1 Tax=Batillaria attramentaria TaxID=370345 RepID=A0ABD0LAL1_9CAEN
MTTVASKSGMSAHFIGRSPPQKKMLCERGGRSLGTTREGETNKDTNEGQRDNSFRSDSGLRPVWSVQHLILARQHVKPVEREARSDRCTGTQRQLSRVWCSDGLRGETKVCYWQQDYALFPTGVACRFPGLLLHGSWLGESLHVAFQAYCFRAAGWILGGLDASDLKQRCKEVFADCVMSVRLELSNE